MLNIIKEIKIRNANIAPEYDSKQQLLNLIDENVWKEVIDICGSPNYDIGELLEYPKFAETVRHAIEADRDIENIYDYIDEESLKKWVENDESFMRQLNKAYSDYIEHKVTQARFDQKILKMWDEEHMYDYGVHIWNDQPANWDYWMERWVATIEADIYDIYDDMDGGMNQYMVDAVSGTSLDEIKIRNVNKPSTYPKDKKWYTIVGKTDYEQVLNTLENEGFLFVNGLHSNVENYTSKGDWLILACNSKVVDWSILGLSRYFNENDYIEINNSINEIKIRNINAPQIHFPKDKRWFIKVNKNNLDQTSKMIDSQGFEFQDVVNGFSDHYTDDYDYINHLLDQGQEIIYAYYNDGHAVDFRIYNKFEHNNDDLERGIMEIPNTLNEIRINNVNNPQLVFPKDENWFIKVDSSNYKQILEIIKKQGFNIEPLQRGNSLEYFIDRDEDVIIFTYYVLFGFVEWNIWTRGGGWDEELTEIPNTLNEIKIRNANVPAQYPKDKDWYVEVNKDNYDKLMNDLKEQGFKFALGYNYIYGTLKNVFSETIDEDKMYVAFNTTTNDIDYNWGFEVMNLNDTDKIQVINEIKIKNANIDPYSDPKQQRKMVYYALIDGDAYLESLTDFNTYNTLYYSLAPLYKYFLDNNNDYTDEESLKKLSTAFENLRSYVEKNGGHMNTLYNKINS